MKKLLLTIIMVMLASAGLYSQIISDTTWLETKKSGSVKNRHNIKDIDRITFQKLTGNPKCIITVEPLLINSASVGQQFYVTVSYNKKMNIESTKPFINFSAGATSFEKDDPNSSWVDDSTYFAVYNIVDKDQQFVVPKVTVKGARDIYANEQDSAVLSDAFILDTRNPEIVKVDFPSYLRICDDAAGEKYSIKFTFNEKMRTRTNPIITPNITACTTTTFTNYTGKWTKDNEFTATYTIADGNVDYDSISFTISNAVDSAGNKIDITPAGKTVTVDTRNPTVTSIGATKTNFNLNDVNSTITLTVSFSEPMMVAPKISFSPDIKNILVIQSSAPHPQFTNRFVYTYKIIKNQDVNFLDVDVIVREAKDSCGNLSVEYTKLDYINVLFLITKVIEENFDTYLTGGPPTTPPWERLLPEGKSNKVQSTWRYSLENSLELEGQQTPTVLNERALQQFSATPDEINFEVFVMADELIDSGGIALVNKATLANFASMTYCTDGKVKIQSGSSAPVTVDFSGADNPYAATVWALIRLQYNKTSGELKFYVNNSLVTTTTGTVPSGTFDSIMLFSNKGKMYFDDILVWHQ